MSTIVPVDLSATPQQVFARLQPRTLVSLLESSKLMAGLSGWSYVCGPALATLTASDGQTVLQSHDADGALGPLATWRQPFQALVDVLSCCNAMAGIGAPRPAGLAFQAGLVGYLGYDLVRCVERLPTVAEADPPWPELRLQLCDHLLAYDHAQAQWHFCTQALPWGEPEERQEVWAQTLAQALEGPEVPAGAFSAGPLRSRTSDAVYLDQVHQLLDFIAAGDIFQANLSHRLEGDFSGDPFALYQALTQANPAPFSAYFEGPGYALASVSPERFLQRTGETLRAHPIKGTRSRGTDAASDEAQRQALAGSTKDRAENLMIVDLMRNDLGRVAQVGSVQAESLFQIEAHPSVWQMVSTLTARLRADAQVSDLLRACWPPGSMTGAPKVRAMEIIETLEPVRRGPYAGALGYLDVGGDLDLSVVIRTALVHGERVMVQVGGAVVADSDPAAELAETYAKGQQLLSVLARQPA
ncbi:MAG: aminodeoxychorismate synthase component I [Pseudomonadota bacterium]